MPHFLTVNGHPTWKFRSEAPCTSWVARAVWGAAYSHCPPGPGPVVPDLFRTPASSALRRSIEGQTGRSLCLLDAGRRSNLSSRSSAFRQREAASDAQDRNERYRITHRCPAVKAQTWILACVKAAPLPTSRHLPLCGLNKNPLVYLHSCATVPLHWNSWTTVPAAVPAPLTSTHLPPAPVVPMPCIVRPTKFHTWAKVTLHGKACTGVKLAVFANFTSRHVELTPFPLVTTAA